MVGLVVLWGELAEVLCAQGWLLLKVSKKRDVSSVPALLRGYIYV